MTTKNHVDSSVAERRLRPIYNWLDDGNNKKALQEADKVLKKQPNFQCAKVLKGLALLRLGKENECQQILDSVRKELQGDDSTLQAMTICYRELNKPEVICDVYSTAAQKDPKNEELLTHLFMAYVRVCDYKKQQQTAMTLYKLKLKNHYYFWTIMSIVMQAHEAGPELAKSLQLPLAEKMVQKFVEEDKIEAEQEVQLYLMILEMQNKLKEALDIVEGPLGEMLHSYIVVSSKRVELLVKMECWERANIEIKKLIENDMDNWSLYLNYFKTVFHILDFDSEHNGTVQEYLTDRTVNDVVKFLTDIKTKNQHENHVLRGPYLAILEFFILLQNHGIDAELHFGFLTDLLLVYFQEFGSKTCCLNDLMPYLNVLSEQQVKTFLDEVWKFIELEEGQLPTSKEQMLRYISNLQITRYLGFHEKLSITAKIQLADCLLRYNVHGAQFNNSNLLPTDLRHNDPFVILVVEIMNDIWLETNDTGYLKNSILVLEQALMRSPLNHQFKILLVKLYNILGTSKCSQKVYELLDVKHVQLDSLGYLQTGSLISTGQYSLASHLFEITLKFFTSNYKDSADHLTFLYKFGSFLKINEFIEFRERLNNSFHYTAITVEKMLLEIFQTSSHQNLIHLIEQMAINPEKENIQFDKLEDNRDLDLCWTSDILKKRLSKQLVKSSFEYEVELIKTRSLVLRVLAGVIQFPSGIPISENGTATESNNIENLKTSPEQTIEILSHQLKSRRNILTATKCCRSPKNIMTLPLDSRLLYLLELPYLEMVEHLISFFDILCCSERFQEESDLIFQQNPVAKLCESVSKLFTEFKSSDPTQLELRCRFLNLLTLMVEMVSIACVFCGACVDLTKSNVNQLKKAKKKKDTSVPDQNKRKGVKETLRVKIVQNLLQSTSLALQDLEACITFIEDKWRETSGGDDMSDAMGLLSLEAGFPEFHDVKEKMTDSYQSSLSEIHEFVKVKSKYVSELQL